MRCFRISAAISSLAALAGCTTTRDEQGVIAMKLSDTQAQIDIGSPAVAVGDHVEIYRHICSKGACRKEIGGHGVVAKIVNSEYSVVDFPKDTVFSQGDAVERRRN